MLFAVYINLPVYSGKHMVNGERAILSSNKSFLFKNKIIDVSTNHLELQIESNNFIDSIIRFISSSSANTKSYPDNATQNMIAVTPSKQCIHFLRSDRWPPTSNILQGRILRLNSEYNEYKHLMARPQSARSTRKIARRIATLKIELLAFYRHLLYDAAKTRQTVKLYVYQVVLRSIVH